jgi:hypothetical protein
MGKNAGLLLILGAVALYFLEKSQSPAGGNTQIPCATGFTNVNGQCVANPITPIPSGGQLPCASGYVAYFNNGVQTCILAPTTDNSGYTTDNSGNTTDSNLI